jgi:hypothetical protein
MMVCEELAENAGDHCKIHRAERAQGSVGQAVNPGFFKGTLVEDAANRLLGGN